MLCNLHRVVLRKPALAVPNAAGFFNYTKPYRRQAHDEPTSYHIIPTADMFRKYYRLHGNVLAVCTLFNFEISRATTVISKSI